MAEPQNQRVIQRLKEAGITMTETPVRPMAESSLLEGKTVVLTGTLERYSRQKAAELVRSLGGKVTNSVTGKTDYVIAGANPGSKYAKAMEMKIPILAEADLDGLLEG